MRKSEVRIQLSTFYNIRKHAEQSEHYFHTSFFNHSEAA